MLNLALSVYLAQNSIFSKNRFVQPASLYIPHDWRQTFGPGISCETENCDVNVQSARDRQIASGKGERKGWSGVQQYSVTKSISSMPEFVVDIVA